MNPVLIGHRGEPETWPENSLAGYEAVLAAGARYIETDVQVTADGIPVLCHDPSLLKITDHNLLVTDTRYETIRGLSAGYPDRFDDKYHDFRVARLDEFVELLKQWPQARAFVEIKHASIIAHGAASVVDTLLEALLPVQQQCILISFEYEALVYAREHCRLPLGWVLPRWSEDSHALADKLGPEYLFCNRTRLPAMSVPLWQGPWEWAIYTVNSIHEMEQYLARGVTLIETNVIRQLLAELAQGDQGRA